MCLGIFFHLTQWQEWGGREREREREREKGKVRLCGVEEPNDLL